MLAWVVLVTLAAAQIVYVPIVAHSKRLGCGLWLMVTALWMGVGFGLVVLVLLPFAAAGSRHGLPPWALVSAIAYSFAPSLAVFLDPRREWPKGGPVRRIRRRVGL